MILPSSLSRKHQRNCGKAAGPIPTQGLVQSFLLSRLHEENGSNTNQEASHRTYQSGHRPLIQLSVTSVQYGEPHSGCQCGADEESVDHILFTCPLHSHARGILDTTPPHGELAELAETSNTAVWDLIPSVVRFLATIGKIT